MHRLQECVRLTRMGGSDREAVRKLGLSPKTVVKVRKALEKAGLLEGSAEALPELSELKGAVARYAPPKPSPQQQPRLAGWAPLIEARLSAKVGPTALYHQLRLEHPELPGSLGSFKRLCTQLKRARGVDPNEVVRPGGGHRW